jgi:hypothetical protein
MEIRTRVDFINYFDELCIDTTPTSPLWIPETYKHETVTCEYFICVKPLQLTGNTLFYWEWIRQNLVGEIRCFSSSSEYQEEWWGFTNRDDIFIWTLRWAY